MAETGQLGVRIKAAYGVGQVAEGIKNTAFAAFLVIYYNQALGLDPALAGLAAAIALGFDAITDPLAGALSDAYQSRWGQRHPFMVVSALPLALTFIMLFSPPAGLEGGALFAWMLVSAIAVRGAMTFYHVPHLALGAELSPDYIERTKIFTYGTLFGYLGAIGMRIFAFPIFFPSDNGGVRNPDNYGTFAVLFGALMAGSILLSAWGTRDRIPALVEKTKAAKPKPFSFVELFRGLRSLLQYRSFRSLFFGTLLTTLIYGIEIFMATYMGLYFWELKEEAIGKLAASMLIGVPASFFVVPWMTRKLDKRNALILATVVLVLCTNIPIISRLLGVFPETGSPLLFPALFFFRVVASTVTPALFIVPASMFADITDEVALKTGERKEGLVFSARSLVGKAAIGLGTAVGGFALKAISFPDKAVPGQVDPDVIFLLGIVEGPATSVFILVGLGIILSYSLDAKRHAEIRAQLAARQQGAQAPASAGVEAPATQAQRPLATAD